MDAQSEKQEFNDYQQHKEKDDSNSKSISNLNLPNQQSTLKLKTVNSNQLKTENGKLIGFGPISGLNNLNLSDLNGMKIAGKLVAVRKDGNSYTFTTATNSTNSTTTKTFTLATPSKNGNAALIDITVSKPQLNTSSTSSTQQANNKNQTTTLNGGTLINVSDTPPKRLYYNKTTNTIEQKSSFLSSTENEVTALNSNNKINTSKPIILQMKRKIQFNDETRKTARIFTIPSQNLINKQTNLANQFIVMNRPVLKSNLMIDDSTSNHNVIKGKTISISSSKPSMTTNSNEKHSRNDSVVVKLTRRQDLITERNETATSITISNANKKNIKGCDKFNRQ